MPATEPEQLAIAAGDHRRAILQEVADGIAKRRSGPVFASDTRGAEDDLRDLALTGIMLLPVDGPEHRLQAPALLCGDPLVCGHLVAVEMTQETVKRRKAVETIAVERDADRKRGIRMQLGVGD